MTPTLAADWRPSPNIPAAQRKLWWGIYRQMLARFNGDKEAAAKVAWGVLKKRGFAGPADTTKTPERKKPGPGPSPTPSPGPGPRPPTVPPERKKPTPPKPGDTVRERPPAPPPVREKKPEPSDQSKINPLPTPPEPAPPVSAPTPPPAPPVVELPPAPPPTPAPIPPPPPPNDPMVQKYGDRLKEISFGAGPPIKTIVSDPSNPLSHTDHNEIGGAHAEAGDLYEQMGQADLAAAHRAAAKHHFDSAAKLQLGATRELMTKKITDGIHSQAHLSDEQKQLYSKGVERVFGAMPGKALELISDNLKGAQWHSNLDSVTQEYGKLTGTNIPPNSYVAGFYGTEDGIVQLDGETTSEVGALNYAEDNVHGTYAHELTHTLDGPSNSLSSSKDWQAAYQEEIVGDTAQPAKLTEYARTEAAEGLAEFGRLLYGTNVSRQRIKQAFPKSYAFFKANGLVD